MNQPTSPCPFPGARRAALALVAALAALGAADCKRDHDAAQKAGVTAAPAAAAGATPDAGAGKRRRTRAVAHDGGAKVGTKALVAAVPDTARFKDLAELRRHPLFAAFAEFVETEDDQEESSSSDTGKPEAVPAAESSDDDDAEAEDDGNADEADVSPDRPPSDLQITRLGVAGETYLLSYEENCGEDQEDQRNLNQVLLERRGTALREVLRKSLCGERERGLAVEVLKLTTAGPELLVRTWALDPEGTSKHTLRAFRVTPEGLAAAGERTDEIQGARQFDASYPETKGLARIELGAQVGEPGSGTRTVLRFALGPAGFQRLEAAAPATQGKPAR